MELQRYSLCPNCTECPEVVVASGAVTIGEKGNQVRLAPAEWDVLVRAIRAGELRPLVDDSAGSGTCDCGCGCH